MPLHALYSALLIMQWFSHSLDVFTQKIRRTFSILTFLWLKTNVAYTRLEVIARTPSIVHHKFSLLPVSTDLLLCIVNYFPQWALAMADSDLAFYYTLYMVS